MAVVSLHRQLSAQRYFFLGPVHAADPEIGYVLRPRSEGVQVLDPRWQTPVKVDRLGFRIPVSASSETPLQPGGVMGIGCSFTFGHGIPAEGTVPFLLGEALHLPAYNLGVCGYATPAAYLSLKRHLPVVKPSVVVYTFANFHIERSFMPSAPASRIAAPYLTSEAGPGRLGIHPPLADNGGAYEVIDWLEPLYARPIAAGSPTPLTPARFLLLVEVMAKAYSAGLLAAPATATTPLPSDEDYGRFVLGLLLDECRRHGATLVLLYTPERYGETCAPGFRRAAAALEGPDFVFVDGAPVLFAEAGDAQAFTRRFSLGTWDVHPSVQRNAVLAAAVARRLDAARPAGS
ncbi:MAG TPA: hypothetical protein VKA21_06535 [Candidatus Binatia bacterium]|nr:hypothetical protein [Candidatus Binatia bacterium]